MYDNNLNRASTCHQAAAFVWSPMIRGQSTQET